MEEPLYGLVHGLPGTGKSRVILFIRRFFEEALGWTYGEEFIFVAFQNRVAHAMKGQTIHSAASIRVGNARSLGKTDISTISTRNRSLKWVVVDEVGMISDHLFGCFETEFSDGSQRDDFFRKCVDGHLRLFGGYNLLLSLIHISEPTRPY